MTTRTLKADDIPRIARMIADMPESVRADEAQLCDRVQAILLARTTPRGISNSDRITHAATELIRLVHAMEEAKGAPVDKMEMDVTVTRTSGKREDWLVTAERTAHAKRKRQKARRA